MAISHVQHNGSSTGGASNLAVTLNGVTAGNLLILCIVTSGPSTTVNSVTDDKSNSWSRVVNRNFQSGAGGVEIWAAHNVAAGNTTITANFSASVTADIAAHEVSGAATVSAFDKSAAAGGTSTTPDSGNTANLSQADEYVIGFVAYGGANVTEASGYNSAAGT